MASTVNGTLLNITLDTNAVEVYSKVDKAAKTASLTAERLVRKLKEQEVALKKGKDQADLYAAAMDGASLDQLAAIASTQNRIRAEHEAAEAMRVAANEERMKAAETQKGKAAVESMIQSLKEQNMVLTRGQDHLIRYRALKAGATKEELRAMKALQMQNQELTKTTKGFQHSTRQGRQFNAMFGQLGMQIQDITVQAQMGTNAGIIAAQQGSQILSIFGAWGAIAGAVMAIAGAAYTASAAMMGAAETAEHFDKKAQDLAGSLKDATSAMYAFHVADATGELREMEKAIEANTKRYNELSNINGEIITEFGENEYNVRKNREEMEELERANAQLADSYATLVNALHPKTEAEKKAEAAIKANANATKNKIADLWEEYETYGMSAEQLVAYTLEKQGATQAQIDEAVALQRSISELDREKKAREEAAEAMRKQAEEEAKLAAKIAKAKKDQETNQAFEQEAKVWDDLGSLEDELAERYKTEAEAIREGEALKLSILEEARKADLISAEKAEAMKQLIQKESAEAQKAITLSNAMNAANAAQDQLNVLANVFGEGSAMAKAAFVANQAIAAANAIVSAEAASAKALEFLPPPFNIPMAATIKGLGYAAAGAIAGQTIASFDGGGIVGGVRSGGVDGVGGKMAVVHPDEAIGLPDQLGGGQPVSVNFSINAVDAEGFDKLLATRQGMIVNMINRAVNNSGRRSIV